MKSVAELILFLFTLFSFPFAFADNKCGENEHWVRDHHRSAYIRYDGTYVSATNVRAHCQGNPPGYTFWRPKLQDGRPIDWSYKKEKTKKWTDEEIEKVIEALGDVPEVLWNGEDFKIYKMDRSETSLNNAATSGKGVIVLYDSAFSSSNNLTRILTHELAHKNYSSLSKKEKREYQEQAGWNSLNDNDEDEYSKDNWINSRTKFVEPDGRDNPNEDFANNIEYFLFNPTKLQLYTPQALSWIKYHYGDKLKLKSAKKEK